MLWPNLLNFGIRLIFCLDLRNCYCYQLKAKVIKYYLHAPHTDWHTGKRNLRVLQKLKKLLFRVSKR